MVKFESGDRYDSPKAMREQNRIGKQFRTRKGAIQFDARGKPKTKEYSEAFMAELALYLAWQALRRQWAKLRRRRAA